MYLKASNKDKKYHCFERIRNTFSDIGDKGGAKLAEDISFEIGTCELKIYNLQKPQFQPSS